MITDGYDRYRQWKLPSMPNHERALYHPDDSDNDLRQVIQTTGMIVNRPCVSMLKYGGGITFGCFFISKKHFRPGGMAASEWTRSVRAVTDTPVADYSAPGVNTTRRVAYRPPIAVSPFLLALKISPHVPSTLSSRSVGRR